MRSNRFRIDLILIFGIVFILGGAVTIGSAFYDLLEIKTARHVQNAETSIISAKSESSGYSYNDSNYSTAYARDWVTEEEMIVNGQVIRFQGRYSGDLSDVTDHTVISNDGIHWKVNDTDTKDVLISSAGGCIFMIMGIVVVILNRKKILKL